MILTPFPLFFLTTPVSTLSFSYLLFCFNAVFFFSNNISLSALAFGNKKDNPVYVSQESGVVGLNFHQSKEVLVTETNGSIYEVSFQKLQL